MKMASTTTESASSSSPPNMFDSNVLSELDKWVKSKGGKVQTRLMSEFYSKHPPNFRAQLQTKLYSLADCDASKVHVVAGNTSATSALEYLELKQLGSRPLRQPLSKPNEATNNANGANGRHHELSSKPAVLPIFTKLDNIEYALLRDPHTVKAQLTAWADIAPFAFDFKGDIRKDGRIALIQVTTRTKQVLMIDLVDNPKMPEESGLKDYFQDANKVKVILDCARPVEALRWIWGIEVNNVFDLSRSYLITKNGEAPARGEQGASLVMMVNELNLPFTRVAKPEESWFKRPLSALQIEYSVRGVYQNMIIYDRIVERAIAKGVVDACIFESTRHANSLRNAPEDRESIDWECEECGFENFARRYTCRKCDTPKPASAIPIKRAAGVAPSVSVPLKKSTGVSPTGQGRVNQEELDRIEAEALRLAMELSLKDEQERLEKSKKSQVTGAEILQKKKKDDSSLDSDFPALPTSMNQTQSPPLSSQHSFGGSQFTLGDSNAFALPAFHNSSISGVDLSSFYGGPSSTLGGFDTGSLLPQSAPFLPAFPPGGITLSPSLVTPQQIPVVSTTPRSVGFSEIPASSMSHRVASPQPSDQGLSGAALGLSDDEMLLLELDTTSLLEDLQMDRKWVSAVVQCAAKVGAKCELVEAPLPLFAKAMEQSGLNVNQRAMILKELHAKKNRQSKGTLGT